MLESENSKRVLLQATYTPIKTADTRTDITVLEIKRPFEKWNLIMSIKPTIGEVMALQNDKYNIEENESSHKDFLRALNTLESVIPELENPNVLHNIERFSEVSTSALLDIVDNIIKLRKKEGDSAIKTLNSIFDAYSQGINNSKKQGSHRQEGIPQTNHKHSMISPSETNLETLLDWAISNNIGDGATMQVMELVDKLNLSGDKATVTSLTSAYKDSSFGIEGIADIFRKRLKTEPIGYLHLERLSFTPVGIERGELVYSVPLSPGEEVNISHKEWSNTSEEFQRIVTDYMENYSEEGVTEKSDLAQSSNSQQQHSNSYNLSVTASGGYGPVNISASAGYNSSDSSNSSAQFSRTQGMTVTRKASSRVRQEHKTSFKVASASGTEDQAVRKIKNPFLDKATRLDYYQLLRKWRVDLIRYGVRLTYDITIPEPGLDVLSRIEEINNINEKLAAGNTFKLTLEEITGDNYDTYFAQYNVPTTPDNRPLDDKKDLPAESVLYMSEDPEFGSYYPIYDNIKLDVDKNYVLSKIKIRVEGFHYGPDDEFNATFDSDDTEEKETVEGNAVDSGNPYFVIFSGYKELIGRSGNLELKYSYGGRALRRLKIFVDYQIKLKLSAFRAWRLETWNAIRDAAQNKYEAERQILENRLSQLKEGLGTSDPLSLRKIEREEIMKGVMRWLFGPSWMFSPYDISERLYKDKGYMENSIISDDTWRNVTLQGEVIKFVHHAIEWENMLYILYPYFWSHNSRWEEKKYLEHPDIMHKAFLKSGSARVVLTIRPGFEKSFVSFIESGNVLLPNQPTPYLTIAEETENYAKTNYPGIPTANPTSEPRPLLTDNQRKTWEDMQIIMKLLDLYFKAYEKKEGKGSYPSKLEELTPYIKEIKPPVKEVPIIDTWGKNFYYQYPGIHGDYDLASYGTDGKPGGGAALNHDGTPNDSADIVSWAEGSLIGTWYEYTPTSALDIAFNETLPSP